MAKKVTIQDIANTANVSKSTVSRVLNDTTPVNKEKREAVLKAIELLDFKPNVFARSLAGGRSMTLGILTQNIGSPFYDAVAQGIIGTLSDSQYSPIVADGQWNAQRERKAIQTLVERQVDGLIIIGGVTDSVELTEACGDKPAVMVGRKLVGWEGRTITVDNVKAAQMATQHLIDLGHRKIAHVAGIGSHQDAAQRLEGYQKALQAAGIPFVEELVFEGNFDSKSGYDAIESLVQRNTEFTAIFAANDEMAMGARLALYEKGLNVPGDISLVGFDNQPASGFMTPPLTTVNQPGYSMGQTAAEAILKLIKDEEIEIRDLSVELTVRKSTAAPKS